MLTGCSVLLLAGGLSPTPLQRLMGFPAAGLPLDRERTLLAAWLEVIDRSLGSLRGSTHLLCGTPMDERWFLAELRRPTTLVSGVEVRRDGRPHRGVCGILADTAEACGLTDWLLVVELNTLPPRSLVPMLEAAAHGPSMVVGASEDERPAGAFLLRAEHLKDVPRRGYLDFKEQFLPQLVSRGHRVSRARLSETSVRLIDRRNYLRAVRIWQSENAESSAERNVSGHSIICRGAEVASDAFILDSVVLPGAMVGSRCVVARSVVGPLIRVPEGSVLVDAVMANARLGDHPAEFRVSSGIPNAETPNDALASWSR
jgi:hypothetical protein